jgi:hypothetical protein
VSVYKPKCLVELRTPPGSYFSFLLLESQICTSKVIIRKRDNSSNQQGTMTLFR